MIAGTFCDPTDHSSAFFSKQKERKKKKGTVGQIWRSTH
jgi:hypothetical protein